MASTEQTINRLLDQVEQGQIGVRDFIRGASAAAAGSPGFGPFVTPRKGGERPQTASARTAAGEAVVAATPVQRTGVVVRIQEVSGDRGNLIEGVVKPGAIEFWQSFSSGTWAQTITAGKAVINVNGKEQTIAKGGTLALRANDRFMFINRGKQPWRFEAKQPMWQPDLFTYEYKGEKIMGSEMWFELKSSRDDGTKRPVYNVLSLDGRGTFVVTLVEQNAKPIRQRNTDGPNVVTVLAGVAGVKLGARKAEKVNRGASMRVANDQAFAVSNPEGVMTLAEIRPDPPRFWNPDASLFELVAGRFSKGNSVWFEFVVPA